MSNVDYSLKDINLFIEEEEKRRNKLKASANITPDPTVDSSPPLSTAEIDNWIALEEEERKKKAQTFDVPYDTVGQGQIPSSLTPKIEPEDTTEPEEQSFLGNIVTPQFMYPQKVPVVPIEEKPLTGVPVFDLRSDPNAIEKTGDFFGNMADSFVHGAKQSNRSFNNFLRIVTTQDDTEARAIAKTAQDAEIAYNEIDRINKEYQGEDPDFFSLEGFERAVYEASKMAGQMGPAMQTGIQTGLTASVVAAKYGTAATIATGGLASIPALTSIPVAFASGFAVGSTTHWALQSAGDMSVEMINDGRDPDTATLVASMFAIPHAFIERMTVGNLLGPLKNPAVQKVVGNKLSEIIAKNADNLANKIKNIKSTKTGAVKKAVQPAINVLPEKLVTGTARLARFGGTALPVAMTEVAEEFVQGAIELGAGDVASASEFVMGDDITSEDFTNTDEILEQSKAVLEMAPSIAILTIATRGMVTGGSSLQRWRYEAPLRQERKAQIARAKEFLEEVQGDGPRQEELRREAGVDFTASQGDQVRALVKWDNQKIDLQRHAFIVYSNATDEALLEMGVNPEERGEGLPTVEYDEEGFSTRKVPVYDVGEKRSPMDYITENDVKNVNIIIDYFNTNGAEIVNSSMQEAPPVETTTVTQVDPVTNQELQVEVPIPTETEESAITPEEEASIRRTMNAIDIYSGKKYNTDIIERTVRGAKTSRDNYKRTLQDLDKVAEVRKRGIPQWENARVSFIREEGNREFNSDLLDDDGQKLGSVIVSRVTDRDGSPSFQAVITDKDGVQQDPISNTNYERLISTLQYLPSTEKNGKLFVNEENINFTDEKAEARPREVQGRIDPSSRLISDWGRKDSQQKLDKNLDPKLQRYTEVSGPKIGEDISVTNYLKQEFDRAASAVYGDGLAIIKDLKRRVKNKEISQEMYDLAESEYYDKAVERVYDQSDEPSTVEQVGSNLVQPEQEIKSVNDIKNVLNIGATGFASIVGTNIKDAQTLGRAFEPLRNSRSEWTYLVLRNSDTGEVLSIDGHSFKLQGETLGTEDVVKEGGGDARFRANMNNRIARLKARGIKNITIDVVHNHPSGNATPNAVDLNETIRFAKLFGVTQNKDGIKGIQFGVHTIVDTGEATEIKANGKDWKMYDVITGETISTQAKGTKNSEDIETLRALKRRQDPKLGEYKRDFNIENLFIPSERRRDDRKLRSIRSVDNAAIGRFLKNDQGKIALAVIIDAKSNIRGAIPFDVSVLTNIEKTKTQLQQEGLSEEQKTILEKRLKEDESQFEGWAKNRRAEYGGRNIVIYYGSYDPNTQLTSEEFKSTVSGSLNKGGFYDAVYIPSFEGEEKISVRQSRLREGAELPEAAVEERPNLQDTTPENIEVDESEVAKNLSPEATQAINTNTEDSASTSLKEEVELIQQEISDSSDLIGGATMEAPVKTKKAYKLMIRKRGDDNLYPLFVLNKEPIPTEVWIEAKMGESGPPTQTGDARVKSSLGPLAARGGFHSGLFPSSHHIGGRGVNDPKKYGFGAIDPESGRYKAVSYRKQDQVWVEVEVPDDVDWTTEARKRGTKEDGTFVDKDAEIRDRVPTGGQYPYKTNPSMVGHWVVSGGIKINRVLSTEEVARLNEEMGGLSDLPTLPEMIDQNNIPFEDLDGTARIELMEYFPEKYTELTGEQPVLPATKSEADQYRSYGVSGVEDFITPEMVTKRSDKLRQIREGRQGLREEVEPLDRAIDPAERQENFNAWFGDSVVVDEQGNPLVVYHGTKTSFEEFGKTKIIDGVRRRLPTDLGYHVGTQGQANQVAVTDFDIDSGPTKGPQEFTAQVMPLYASIKNPLRLTDKHGYWDVQQVLVDINAGEYPELNTKKIRDTFDSFETATVKRDYDLNDYLELEGFKKALNELGYDGIVYLNRYENIRKKKTNELLTPKEINSNRNFLMKASDEQLLRRFNSEDSYIALEPTQLKSATGNMGTFDPDNPSVLKEEVDPLPLVDAVDVNSEEHALIITQASEGDFLERDGSKLIGKNEAGKKRGTKAGGALKRELTPEQFAKAIEANQGSSTLTKYKIDQLKEMRLFKLRDAEIYFALKTHDKHWRTGRPEIELTAVINNESRERAGGVAVPAVMLKAIEEGATLLEAFDVPFKESEEGFLPRSYGRFFNVTKGAELPFDPDIYLQDHTEEQLGELYTYWEENFNFNRNQMGLFPPSQIMRFEGGENERQRSRRLYLGAGTLNRRRASEISEIRSRRLYSSGRGLVGRGGTEQLRTEEGSTGGMVSRDDSYEQYEATLLDDRFLRAYNEVINLSPELKKDIGINPDIFTEEEVIRRLDESASPISNMFSLDPNEQVTKKRQNNAFKKANSEIKGVLRKVNDALKDLNLTKERLGAVQKGANPEQKLKQNHLLNPFLYDPNANFGDLISTVESISRGEPLQLRSGETLEESLIPDIITEQMIQLAVDIDRLNTDKWSGLGDFTEQGLRQYNAELNKLKKAASSFKAKANKNRFQNSLFNSRYPITEENGKFTVTFINEPSVALETFDNFLDAQGYVASRMSEEEEVNKYSDFAPKSNNPTTGYDQTDFDKIDAIRNMFSNPLESESSWNDFMFYLTGGQPFTFKSPKKAMILSKNSNEVVSSLSNLTDTQQQMALEGLEVARNFRRMYATGEMQAEDTAALMAWGIMSRMLSPFGHEATFLDAMNGPDGGLYKYIQQAVNGDGSSFGPAKESSIFKTWAKTVIPEGSPAKQGTSNLNSVGSELLRVGSQEITEGDYAGRTRLQAWHEVMSDMNLTGKEKRRLWLTLMPSSGIKNKVLSFMLLTTGHEDVIILDRVQGRNMWGAKENAEDYTASQIYVPAYTEQIDGVRGLAIYEALEDALENSIQRAYSDMGRDGSMGIYHWESWVAESSQEVGHSTLSAILNHATQEEKNPDSALNDVFIREGKFRTVQQGWKYGITDPESGQTGFILELNDGSRYVFDLESGNELKKDVLKPKFGVVPKGYAISGLGGPESALEERTEEDAEADEYAELDELTTRWLDDPEVNYEAFAKLVEDRGVKIGEARERGTDDRQADGSDPSVRLGTGLTEEVEELPEGIPPEAPKTPEERTESLTSLLLPSEEELALERKKGTRERGYITSAERQGRITPTDPEARFYEQQSNAETQAEARDIYVQGGITAVENRLKEFEQDKEYGALSTALGIERHAHYEKEAEEFTKQGKEQEAIESRKAAAGAVEDLSERLTRAGQETQAARMITILNPETIGLWYQSRINKINKEFGLEEKNVLGFKKKERKVSEANIAKLKALSKQARLLKDLGVGNNKVDNIIEDLLSGKDLNSEQMETLKDYRDDIKALESESIPIGKQKDGKISKSGFLGLFARKISKNASSARARLRGEQLIRAGIPVDIFSDLISIGLDNMVKGATSFNDFNKALREEFTPELSEDISKSDMHTLFTETQKLYGSGKTKAKEQFFRLQTINKFISDFESESNPEVSKLVSAVREIQGLNEDRQVELGEEIHLMLQRLEPRTMTNYLMTAVNTGRLLSPVTFFRNIIGNQIFWEMENITRLMASGQDYLLSKATGAERSITYTRQKSHMFSPLGWIRGKGFAPELMEGFKAGYTGRSPKGVPLQADMPIGRTFDPLSEDYRNLRKYNPLKVGYRALGVLEGIMSANLRGFDYAAYMRAYNTTMQEQALNALQSRGEKFKDKEAKQAWIDNWVAKATERTMAMADETAKYVTFQDESGLSQASVYFKRLLNLDRGIFNKSTKPMDNLRGRGKEGRPTGQTFAGPLEGFLGNMIIPFAKVPANLINRGIAYSPAGGIKTIRDFYRLTKAYQNKDALGLKEQRRELLLGLNRALIGSGVTWAVVELVKLGLLRGDDEDRGRTKELKRLKGDFPYSFNVSGFNRWVDSGFDPSVILDKNGKPFDEDRMVSWNWMQPLSLSMGFATQYGVSVKRREQRAGKKGGKINNSIDEYLAGIEGATAVAFDQPMLQGLRELTRGYGRNEGEKWTSAFTNIAKNMPASMVPQLAGKLRYALDPNTRDPYTSEGFVDQMTDRFVNRLPWLSKTLPKAYAAVGLKERESPYLTGWGNIFLNPMLQAHYKIDPVIELLLDNYEETGSEVTLPRKLYGMSKTATTVKIAGKEFSFGKEEKSEMQKIAGEYLTFAFDDPKKVALYGLGLQSPNFMIKNKHVNLIARDVKQAADLAKAWFIFNRIENPLTGEDFGLLTEEDKADERFMFAYQRERANAIKSIGIFNQYKNKMGLRATRPEALFEPVR